jgi:peptide/nickel transport system permease protein
VWHRFARNRAAVAGLVWIVLSVAVALAAPYLGTRDPHRTTRESFRAPGEGYLLGTDNLGRDVYSGVLFGSQVSFLVGVSAAAAATTLGIAVGGLAGYYGGRVDALLMRTSELFQILPQFILALLIVALFGSGLEKVIFVIAILGWPLTARLVRAEFLSLKQREFVEAARALGTSDLGIGLRVLLPNALPPAIVAGSLGVAQAILLEAGLSFFGLGDPNRMSWGLMLNNAQGFLRRAWWMSLFPGAAIALAVLAFNLFGDGINDALNPRLEER